MAQPPPTGEAETALRDRHRFAGFVLLTFAPWLPHVSGHVRRQTVQLSKQLTCTGSGVERIASRSHADMVIYDPARNSTFVSLTWNHALRWNTRNNGHHRYLSP